jgi:recombinational DNA repair ATPase RecF
LGTLAEAKHVTKVNRLMEERKKVEANLQQLAEELEAEKAKHAAEVNAVRAQCYSQIKAAAIKYISELMPEPLPVMGKLINWLLFFIVNAKIQFFFLARFRIFRNWE